MENIKVKVSNKAESKEVQELLESLGLEFVDVEEYKYPQWLAVTQKGGTFSNYKGCKSAWYTCSPKEITITQLRDMVVLKRNCVEDATHGNAMYPYVKLSDGWYYFDKRESNKWIKSSGGKPSYYENLKPIEEKEMKEFLVNHDGKWTLQLLNADTEENSYRVAVPNGADLFAVARGNRLFYAKTGELVTPYKFIYEGDFRWSKTATSPYEIGGFVDRVLWQRSETKSLNDTYAEIEQVRQETIKVTIDELKHSQWDVQVGGDHYKSMRIQPAKFALENKLDYCQANAIKYICRHDSKCGKQDLEKAKHYIDLLIEHYYGDEDE